VPGREHPNVVGDVRAALGFVANWRLIATQHTYAGITADPSPVQHYWSLGIEEQFYLVFPLLVAVCLRWRRAALATVLALLAGGSLVLQLAVQDPTRTYFGTDTRALELLVGTLLALWWTRSSLQGRAPVGGRVRRRGRSGADRIAGAVRRRARERPLAVPRRFRADGRGQHRAAGRGAARPGDDTRARRSPARAS